MHQQVRVDPVLSPPDLERVLKIVADAPFNILAVGGSNVEHGGEFGFAVEPGQQTESVKNLLVANGYKARIVEVRKQPDDLAECIDLFWLSNQPGQLHASVQKVAAFNKSSGKAIQDIAIGVPGADGRIPVQIYSARRG